MELELSTPIHIIHDSRYARQDGWQIDDVSLCSSGIIAVSGSSHPYQTYVSIYNSIDDNSDSRDKPILLYHKQFTDKVSWRSRCISFIKPNSTEIVTCQYDELQVIDYNRDVVLRFRKVNGVTTCVSVSESQVFIGLLMSDIVNIYDNDLNRIKSIRLKRIRRGDYPDDIIAAEDRLYVCTLHGRAIVYSPYSGNILMEYTTGQDSSKAYSIAVNIQLQIVVVLWDEQHVSVYSFSGNNCLVDFDVASGVSRIRISDRGKIVTGNLSGEIKIYDLGSFLSYSNLKENLASSLTRDYCEKLTNFFAMGGEELNIISSSERPATSFVLALEEKGVIQPSNVDRLEEAFHKLKMSPSLCHTVDLYKKFRASATAYDRFLVTLSAHLTASLAINLCGYFNIPENKKWHITSNQNPGLTVLLTLNEMGIINESSVLALQQPFTNFRLVQAVAKILEYQSLIRYDKELFQNTSGLSEQEKKHLFIKLLQKKIISWYEAMTPVPWKKSCGWKSSDLFVGGGLILTTSKTHRSVRDVDEKCKLNYTELFDHENLKEETRIIIEGEPGSGKTMLSSQLAYDWSQGKIGGINVLILLPLKFVQSKTLAEATKDFYLNEYSGLSTNDIEEVIIGEGRKCCFLLDGLEEYNGHNHTSSGEHSEVMKVMTKVEYPNCKVILTSRSDFIQDLPSCPLLKLGPFSEVQRQDYLEKVFLDDYETQMKVKNLIDKTPFILDLCSIPLLFVLAVHNIGSIVNVQDDWQDTVSPFIEMMVESLCPLEQMEENFGVEQTSHNISLELLAFNGLCRGTQQLLWQKAFVEENVRNIKQYLDSGILVVEEVANAGKTVKQNVQKDVVSEQAGEVKTEDNENMNGKRHSMRGETAGIGRTFKGQEEYLKEKSQVLKKRNNKTPLKEEESTLGRKSLDEFEKVEHEDVANSVEPVQEQRETRKYTKTSLAIQHVSVQVKFLHKIFQEWFAARYLADIFWKYGELELLNKYKFFREHLLQINPADLHYVLRFTCAICPPTCHLILNYLLTAFRSKEGKLPGHVINCICLCLAEYNGYKGHYIKDVLSEVCKADISIHSEDNRLLQRAKVVVLQLASECGLPISRLQLISAIKEASKDEVILSSGTSLKILNTLQTIEMSQWDSTLREEDYSDIVKYVINSASLKKALLSFPNQPPTLDPKTLNKAVAKQVTVDWHIGQFVQTLDLSSGLWSVNIRDARIQPDRVEAPKKTIQEPQPSLERKAVLTNEGGVLEIPNTGVVLLVPPNALPEETEHCEINIRIVRRDVMTERTRTFSSNSSTIVELLPNNLRFRCPVRLSVPHCLVLDERKERKARILLSHHEKGNKPQWEEHTHFSYHLEDTACIILLDRFSWVTFSVDDEIVEAKKLVLYTAARKPQPHDEDAEIHVGYYLDLPGVEQQVFQGTPDLDFAHRKTFFFDKIKEKLPLSITLKHIYSSESQHKSLEGDLKEITYNEIEKYSYHFLIFYVEMMNNPVGYPLCIFNISQKNSDITVQLTIHPKVEEENSLPAQSFAPTVYSLTVTKAGGRLVIPDTGVSLSILPDAIPPEQEGCDIHMSLTPSRIFEGQVKSFCSSSCTAVEISPCGIELNYPAQLILPHCLSFDANQKNENSVKISTNLENGSPSPWKIRSDIKYELKEDTCILQLNTLCCVKYSVDDTIVKAKRLAVYTAAKTIKQKDRLAEIEVGYFSDIPSGGELLQLNPPFRLNLKRGFFCMKEEASPLQVSLERVRPTRWTCWFPTEKPQEIPFSIIASSKEHSHLYVLQTNENKLGSIYCKFLATQKDSSIDLSARLITQEDQKHCLHEKECTDSMTSIFQYLSENLANEWRDVGRNLGLTDAELDIINANYPNDRKEAIYRMFLRWKQTQGNKATYNNLIKALQKARLKELADNV